MATQSGSASNPGIPNRNQLSQYVVNREGWEGVKWKLYDFQPYPAAGASQLTFFALPLGQGVGFGGGSKTYSDTNMNLAGQVPANQEFLIQSIEVHFWPTTPTVAANMPAAFGAQAVAAQVNDTYIFRRAGNLQLLIGSKPYLIAGPLSEFPPKSRFGLNAALADVSTAGADLQSRIAYADVAGRAYNLHPASLLLQANQNFSVTLNWPEGLQNITNPARVGVLLDGYLYRRSQ